MKKQKTPTITELLNTQTGTDFEVVTCDGIGVKYFGTLEMAELCANLMNDYHRRYRPEDRFVARKNTRNI